MVEQSFLESGIDPMADICSPSYCIRTYSMNHLKILNELDNAVWISTYEPGNTHFLWANEAALRLWNKTNLDAFISTDLVTGRSVAVSIIHEELYNDVQVQYLAVDQEIYFSITTLLRLSCIISRIQFDKYFHTFCIWSDQFTNYSLSEDAVPMRQGGDHGPYIQTHSDCNLDAVGMDGVDQKTQVLVFAVPVTVQVESYNCTTDNCRKFLDHDLIL